MKRLMNKLVILLALGLLFSCNKKSKLENIFIGGKKDYWNYKDNCQKEGSKGIYFKFNKKGDYDKYLSKPINEGNGFDLFNNDGDLMSDPRNWSIKNDSTFVWDGEDYKIERYTKDNIILSYYHYKEKNKKCIVTFEKVVDK
jgi:hypothetical protein